MSLKSRLFAVIITWNIISADSRDEKPNIVFIIADDWGWDDVGIHGSNQIKTPNLDALAYSSVVLHNYYTMSLCSPSRSSLMTGMHAARIGMQHGVLEQGQAWGLPLDLKILPQYLKDDGYRTYAVGKWHLGDFKTDYLPTKRGFDYHLGYWEGHEDYFNHTVGNRGVPGYDFHHNLDTFWSAKGKYSTDLFTDEAVDIIRSHDNSHPLFLYVAHQAVHAPLEAPEGWMQKFSHIKNKKRRKFAAMLWKLDESVGKIVSTLGEREMLTNTIIVMTTDNGAAVHGYDRSIGSSWPLRGGKASFWEGGIRGNAWIWSSKLPSSQINHHLMHIQDWLPTLLGAVNSSHLKHEDLNLDGVNMWPVLTGETKTSYDEVILQADPKQPISYAYRQGNFKLLHGAYSRNWWYLPPGRESSPSYDIDAVENSQVARTFKNSKLNFPSVDHIQELRANMTIHCSPLKSKGKPCDTVTSICLFDLEADPCEENNLAEDMPHVVDRILKRLEDFTPGKPLNQPYDRRSLPIFWKGEVKPWCDFVNCTTTLDKNSNRRKSPKHRRFKKSVRISENRIPIFNNILDEIQIPVL